jgi:hypothetical protein
MAMPEAHIRWNDLQPCLEPTLEPRKSTHPSAIPHP